jgi:hypothetical protein
MIATAATANPKPVRATYRRVARDEPAEISGDQRKGHALVV